MKYTFTFNQILRQLKADLIGKDSYRGVSLSYSWLANQFGHFSLGFIPTLLAYILIKSCIPRPTLMAPIIVSTIWCLFELYNFLGPLLAKRNSTAKNLYVPLKNEYVFKPAWRNVAYDTFTDLLFFWLGAFSASLFLFPSLLVICILIFLGVVMLLPAHYWYTRKMYLQYARLPVQFRLSQWQGDIDESGKASVLSFIKEVNHASGKHFLIFGGRCSGKSLLGIALGTEFSIKGYSTSYYTAMKWYHLLSLEDSVIIKTEDCQAWSWRKGNVLIIDDINPGNPVPENFVLPENVLSLIDDGKLGTQNKSDLKTQNVVWILGDSSTENSWIEMVKGIGIPSSDISIIDLGFSLIQPRLHHGSM
jgi:hypothetical protein